jgi:hypothetical protein
MQFSCWQTIVITAKLPFGQGFRYDWVIEAQSGESRLNLPLVACQRFQGFFFGCIYCTHNYYRIQGLTPLFLWVYLYSWKHEDDHRSRQKIVERNQ